MAADAIDHAESYVYVLLLQWYIETPAVCHFIFTPTLLRLEYICAQATQPLSTLSVAPNTTVIKFGMYYQPLYSHVHY